MNDTTTAATAATAAAVQGSSITAVYAGTFDPMTLGHARLMQRAAGLFGQLIVAVAAGHHKRTMFSLEERLAMAAQSAAPWPHIKVLPFDGLLRDFVLKEGAQAVVRGVRGIADFDYEVGLAGMNRQLMPGVETLFMPPSDEYQFVSSTLVREIATLGGDVSRFVSPAVLQRLLTRVQERASASAAVAAPLAQPVPSVPSAPSAPSAPSKPLG